MLAVERQRKLVELLRLQQSAQLDDLATTVGVSTSTVRRDIDQLEQQGLVERTHGGVLYRGNGATLSGDVLASNGTSRTLSARMQEDVEAKQAIGRYAASLVQPHMTLLLDAGSTVIYAAQLIEARPLQIVTNSLTIANIFIDDDDVELLVVGGSLYPRTGALVGPIAMGCLADLHADMLFFSLAGIYGEDAFNIQLTMAQVEQMMMRQAAQSVMLMDASKFGRKSLVRVCSVNEVDAIVTDQRVGDDWREGLGDRLVVA